MMKECTQRAFAMLSHEKQTDFRNRYGQWYESQGQFLQALAAYNKALNYDAALAVIQKDAGILLASLSPEKVLAFLDVCPTGNPEEQASGPSRINAPYVYLASDSQNAGTEAASDRYHS